MRTVSLGNPDDTERLNGMLMEVANFKGNETVPVPQTEEEDLMVEARRAGIITVAKDGRSGSTTSVF